MIASRTQGGMAEVGIGAGAPVRLGGRTRESPHQKVLTDMSLAIGGAEAGVRYEDDDRGRLSGGRREAPAETEDEDEGEEMIVAAGKRRTGGRGRRRRSWIGK